MSDPFTHTVEPPPRPRASRSEAFFQALIEGLLMLLYMSGIMILTHDLLGRPLSFVGWGIQGVLIAVFIVLIRMRQHLAGNADLMDPVKVWRRRWTLVALSGGAVAAACVAKLALARTLAGPERGLLIAAVTFLVTGLVGRRRVGRGTIRAVGQD